MINYHIILLLLGISFFCASWLPKQLKGGPISLPFVWVIVGLLLPYLIPHFPNVNPLHHTLLMERLTEITVLISLLGAGLKIDKKMGWKSWKDTWLLLGLAMPLSIAALTLSAFYIMALPLALALLLGGAMAPTDPVLAADVQVGPPGKGNEDDVRFALTSEAGLNDGLAFPFVHFAILLFTIGYSPKMMVEWLFVDLVGKIIIGIVVGIAIGRLAGWYLLRGRKTRIEGFLALALMLITYAASEIAHGYGFLAVFLAARAFRGYRRSHEHHVTLHEFSDQIERLLVLLLLLIIGVSISQGLFTGLKVPSILVAFIFVLVIRPVVGMISLLTSKTAPNHKAAIAVFGIRGIGSFYYLTYAFTHCRIPNYYMEEIWISCVLIVLTSIILHGISVALLWPKLVAPPE